MTLRFNKRLSITPVEEGGGGGGDGEIITAINAFGSNIKSGDKVWLNKHNNPQEVGTDFVSGFQNNPSQVIYDFGNILYQLNSQLSRVGFANNTFNYTTIQTSIANIYGMTPVTVDGIMTIVDLYQGIYKGDTTCCIVNPSTGLLNIKNWGMYIGDNKYIKWNNDNRSYDIVEYNPETNVEGSVLGSIPNGSGDFRFEYYDKNTKTLLVWKYGDWYSYSTRYLIFYDLTDLSNITVKSSTQLSNETLLYSLTGVNTGDVVFIIDSGMADSWTKTPRSCIKRAYRIKSDGTLEACTDVPPLLQSLFNTGAYMMFNSITNILSVGTDENIYFFRFNQTTKEFTQITFDITMPTDATIVSGYNYIPIISEDFSTLSILYPYNSGNNDNGIKMYKLVAQGDDNWYAEPYTNFNPNTLTGKAKDNIVVGMSGDVAIGGYINNQDKIIITNGTYVADNGYTGLGTIDVNVTPRLGAVNIPATTSAQTVKAAPNFDGFYKVTVPAVTSSIDNNITAGNIKSGVTILGITGNYSGSGVSIESVIGIQPVATIYADLTIQEIDGMEQPLVNCSIDDSYSDLMFRITGKHFQQNRFDSTLGSTWTSDDGELTLNVDYGSIDPSTHVDEFGNTVPTYPSVFALYGYYEDWGTGELEHMIVLTNSYGRGSGIMMGEGQIMYYNSNPE